MKTPTKILITTGILAGIGVSGVSLTSYAANDSANTAVTVNLTVSDSIAISSNTNTINLGTIATNATTTSGKSAVLTVNSNNLSGYTVSAAGTSLAGGTGTTAIPYGSVTSGTSAWGMSKTTDSGYGAITDIATTSAKSATSGDTYTIYFGASTSATQETGTYSGTATFTATNK